MKAQHRICATAAMLMFALPAIANDDIRFEGFPDYDSQLEKVLPDFQEQSGLSVDVLMNEWEEHHNRLTTTLGTGRGAGDVVLIDVGQIGGFVGDVGEGGLLELSERFDGLDDEFADYAVRQGQSPEGNQYGIPVDIGPGVMYYRRDLMEDAGYDIDDVTDSWEGYLEYGRWLRDEHDTLLIGNASSVAQAIIFTEVDEGEGFYFDHNGDSLITSDRFVRAFEMALTIREEGLDGRVNDWTEDWYEGFKDGSFATELSGAWLLGHLQNWIAPETAGEWGVEGLPAGRYGSWGGAFLAIPEQSDNHDEAWEMIEYLVSQDTQIRGFENIAAFPANTETYDHPMFDEDIEFLRGQKARQLFAEIAENIEPVTPHDGDHIAYDLVIEDALARVLDDGVDVMDALEEAEQQLMRRLRRL